MEFSADGQRLAVGYKDKTIQVWDVATGLAVGPPLILVEGVSQLNWHPNGRILAIACLDGSVRFWDAVTAKPIGPRLLWLASAVAFTEDGKNLLVGSSNHPVRSWRVPQPIEPQGADLVPWARAWIGQEER